MFRNGSSSKSTFHHGRRRHENHMSDDLFWKTMRDNFAEIRQSLKYISKLNQELNLRDEAKKRHAAESIPKEEDFPEPQKDEKSSQKESGHPKLKEDTHVENIMYVEDEALHVEIFMHNNDATEKEVDFETKVDKKIVKRNDDSEKSKKKEKSVDAKKGQVMKVYEASSVLFSKRHLQDLVTERSCFLMGALKPSVPRFSFEFMQVVKSLIEKENSRVASKMSQCGSHETYESKRLHEKHHSNFTSYPIQDQKSQADGNPSSARLKDAHDFKFAMQGDPLDSRTNPLEEGEDDMNQIAPYVMPQGPITRSRAEKEDVGTIHYNLV